MTGAARAFAMLFVALHILALFAYTLRWLWVAMLATALLIHAARAEELAPPTPQEAIDIQRWIPATCCRTNNCCRKVHEGALIQLPNNQVRVVTTGQVLPRTGWSQDGQTWRCTCDYDDATKQWVVHPAARTLCVFPVPAGS
jgi:hypothetical protein